MPTQTKYRKNINTYGTRNTYEIDRLYSGTGTVYDFPVSYPKPRPKQPAPAKKTQAQSKPTVISGKKKKQITKAAAVVSVFFVLCLSVLYRYGTILKCNQDIKALEAELDAVIASNQAIQTKIDKQLEMSEIEKYAKDKLGMMRPESYQVFYIDMNLSDSGSEGSVPNDAGAVSGTAGTLMNAFRVLK